MRTNFQPCLDFAMLPENDGQAYHVDSGGPTSWGVTRATWSRWIGRPASVSDMQEITPLSTANLYRAWYWNTINGNSLPVGLDLMVFDMGITCGEHTAAVQLQEVLGFSGHEVDGAVGPLTIARASAADLPKTIEKLSARQSLYYHACATFPINGRGWLARLKRRSTAALAMLPTTT